MHVVDDGGVLSRVELPPIDFVTGDVPFVIQRAPSISPTWCGLIASLTVVVLSSLDVGRYAHQVWTALHRFITQRVLTVVVIIFIWVCVARASAMTDDEVIVYNHVVRAHAGYRFILDHIHMASSVTLSWTNTVLVPNLSHSECVYLGGTHEIGPTDYVEDSGAMRSVLNQLDLFVPTTLKLCPFQIRV